jgi:hypothetical protein
MDVIGSGNCSLQYTRRSYISVHLVSDLGSGELVVWQSWCDSLGRRVANVDWSYINRRFCAW